LTTRVRVNLGVEDKDIDVLAGSEDVIESAEADVEGLPVAAKNPYALADECVGDGQQVARIG